MDRTWMIGVLLLAACGDKGSLGNYEGGTGDGSGESGAPETSASTVSATTDSASTTSVSGTDTDFNTTGEPLTCEGGNGCPLTIDCDERHCGEVTSIFDPNGCVRPTCQGDDACGDMEACFVAIDFGLCEASATECSDDLEGPDPGCDCGGTADCNGGHCVEALELPVAAIGALPTQAVLEQSCGEADGIVTTLRVFDQGPVDGCTPPEGAQELLTLTFMNDALEVAEYQLQAAAGSGNGTEILPDSFGGGGPQAVQRAIMSIDETDGETAQVSVDAWMFYMDTILVHSRWEIDRVNVCRLQGGCG